MRARETFFQIILVFVVVFLVIFIHFTQNQIDNLRPQPTGSGKENPKAQYTLREDEDITIIFLGDIMLGRSVMKASMDNNDPIYPFRNVSDRLREADLVFANLENPVISNCPIHEGGFKFCTSVEMLQGLIYAGVDVVSLANNHSGNYGTEGLEETKRHLASAGIKYVEQGELTRVDIAGVSFGFLGFDYVFKKPKEYDYLLINDANDKVDVLVVSPHWGVEYTSEPTEEQRGWAGRMVESGADVIVGHHPHWVQVAECTDGNPPRSLPAGKAGWIRLAPGDIKCDPGSIPVFYSLGNFIFDQMWSEETRKGILVELTFRNNDIVKQQITPAYIKSIGQPELLDSYESAYTNTSR